MTTGAPQSSDRTDVAGRAGLVGALTALAVGLLAGNLQNRFWLYYALPPGDELVSRVTLAATWPGWVLPGARGGSTVITLMPLALAALVTYAITRWRLPHRPQTAAAVYWTSWRATVAGGTVGALAHLVSLFAAMGLVPFIGLSASPWWQLAYGAGWGGLAGLLTGWAAVLVTRSSRRPEGPPPLQP